MTNNPVQIVSCSQCGEKYADWDTPTCEDAKTPEQVNTFRTVTQANWL